MWPDRVSNPGPLTYESDALPTALRGLAPVVEDIGINPVMPTRRFHTFFTNWTNQGI